MLCFPQFFHVVAALYLNREFPLPQFGVQLQLLHQHHEIKALSK
jgi:hypothetical protein